MDKEVTMVMVMLIMKMKKRIMMKKKGGEGKLAEERGNKMQKEMGGEQGSLQGKGKEGEDTNRV